MDQNFKRLSKRDYLKEGRHIRAERRRANSFPLHSHDYFEIEIVLGGRGVQHVNSKEYELTRGSVYLLTPADFHEIVLDEKNELWNIVFDETVLKSERLQSLFEAKELCRRVSEEELFKLERAAELIAAEAESGEFVEPLVEYLLEIIFPSRERSEELSPVRKAVLYMETHFRENPSLAETAERVCLSPIYFGSLFKKTTGETYVNYLNRCKINCAMMLLENGMSVSRACFDSGFGSLSGFLYTFKKTTGVSPNEYRNAHFVSSR